MKEKIITLQGIRLERKAEKLAIGYGPMIYLVNGKMVEMWSYERSKGDFYTEDIRIKAFATQINKLTGEVS